MYIKITEATNQETEPFEIDEWPYADMEHYGKKVKYNNKKFIFKAEIDNKVVGCIKGKIESGVLNIDYLIVAHDKKGLGIGKELTSKAEDFGKKEGAHKVHLYTGKGWEAEKFYQKLGYRQLVVIPNHNFNMDFVIYEKEI